MDLTLEELAEKMSLATVAKLKELTGVEWMCSCKIEHCDFYVSYFTGTYRRNSKSYDVFMLYKSDRETFIQKNSEADAVRIAYSWRKHLEMIDESKNDSGQGSNPTA